MKLTCINNTDCYGLTIGMEYDCIGFNPNDTRSGTSLIVMENDVNEKNLLYYRDRFRLEEK